MQALLPWGCLFHQCSFKKKCKEKLSYCGDISRHKFGCVVFYAPVKSLPTGGGAAGIHEALDRREFDKLMKSWSRVIDFGRFLHPRHLMHQAGFRVGIWTKMLSLRWGFRLQTFKDVKFPQGQPAAPGRAK